MVVQRTSAILTLCLFFSFVTAEVLSVCLTSDPFIFKDNTPVINGFNKLQIPGTPILPAKSIVLALPPGAQVVSVDVHYSTPTVHAKENLTIAPPHLPISLNKEITRDALEKWHKRKSFIESFKGTYPAKTVCYSKMSCFRNIPFIRISYFPILCTQDALLFYNACYLAIHYYCEEHDNSIARWVDRDAALFFSNWDEMKKYYDLNSQVDSFDYLIITKDSLFSAFDSLVAWKSSIGYSPRLVSVDSIITQYPGVDNADRIRSFLVDKYLPWGIHYVLIAGNVDMIPMKICYPDSNHAPVSMTPTDYYFAELTDNWDSDGDGYYGEYEQDSIGFVPEVIVGRIPFNDTDTLKSIVEKTVNYEKDTGSWKNRALLLAAFFNFENEDNSGCPECDGAVLMETIKDSILGGWQYTRMYEETGLCPSVYPHEYALTLANVAAEWSLGNYGIANWCGHGAYSGTFRKWWNVDDGDSIPEGPEMAMQYFVETSTAQSYDDTHPPIVFSASCSNAAGTDNLARTIIGNGAAGIVAGTTYGWYIPGWDDPSDGDLMSLDYYFFYYLISQVKKTGDALFNAKVYYFNNLYFPDPWAGDPEWTPQQNLLGFTLFGDPSLVRQGVGIEEQLSSGTAVSWIKPQPNPMHTKSSIQFQIPCQGKITISLFNILGQRLTTLCEVCKEAGTHSVPFVRNNLPSGVYFIKFEFENSSINSITIEQKIIIL